MIVLRSSVTTVCFQTNLGYGKRCVDRVSGSFQEIWDRMFCCYFERRLRVAPNTLISISAERVPKSFTKGAREAIRIC